MSNETNSSQKEQYVVIHNLHDTNTGPPSIVLAKMLNGETPVFEDIREAQGYLETIHPACEPRIVRGNFKSLKFRT